MIFRHRIKESSVDDINRMVVYALKEKLKIHDSSSTLPDLDDMAFLRDLKLIAEENGQVRLTVAGLLFVGKEQSIRDYCRRQRLFICIMEKIIWKNIMQDLI